MKKLLSKKKILIIILIIVLAVPAVVLPIVLTKNEPSIPEEVAIIFVSDDVVYHEVQILKGAIINSMPNPPSKEGYTFGGWFSDKDVWEALFDENAPVQNDLTLYAYWEEDEDEPPISYVINVAGGTLHTGETYGAFYEGTNAIITAVVPEGQRFAYWLLAGSDDHFADNPHGFGVDANMEWTAVFESITGYYRVTVSGGTLEGGGITASFEAGTCVTVTADIPEGQSFYCWQIDDEEFYVNPYTFVLGEDDIEIAAMFQEEIVESERGLQYNYDEDLSGYIITSFIDSGETSILIPNNYDNGINGNRQVVKINENVFKFTSLKIITLPSALTTIGNEAFAGCFQLDAVYIPQNVEYIGANVFDNCPNLTLYCEHDEAPEGWNISWNGSGGAVRWGCKGTGIINGIRYVKLSDTTAIALKYTGTAVNFVMNNTVEEGVLVTEIAPRAFGANQTMKRITLPNALTLVGEGAFSSCYRLTAVITKSLTPALLANNVLPNDGMGICLYVPESKVEDYKLAAGWNNYANSIYSSDIIDGAFAVYEGELIQYLGISADVVLPEGITNIDIFAFLNHTAMETLTISSTVENIEGLPFAYFPGFTSVILDADNTHFVFDGGTLYNQAKTKLIWYPHFNTAETYSAPDTLTEIGASGLTGSRIKSAEFKNVESIGAYAFLDCSELQEITFDSVTPPIIDETAFLYLSGITVIVPKGAVSAYDAVFGEGFTIVEKE